MSDKQPKTQKYLPFPEESRGEAPRPTDGGSEPLTAKRRTESSASTGQWMEEVCSRLNLRLALKRVRANKGGPGIDGMTVAELPAYLKGHWPILQEQLLVGTYEPKPVKRVEIPKEGGGVRTLGIPCVLDRFIQQAVLQVLQPRWDPTFSDHSYGFRPGRSPHQAIARAQSFVAEGYAIVVDTDLKNFFDEVNHDMLMGRVAKRVADKRLLKLLRAFLNAGMMIGGVVSQRVKGTPQGGPLSPLLSNLLLDDLDRELERRGHRFVRYADDCNIYVRTARSGHRVMKSVKDFVTRKLKLKVNEEKSAVGTARERKFLSFRIGTSSEPTKRRIARQALTKFKMRVKERTRGTRGQSIEQVVEGLAVYLRGWIGYFGFCETPSTLRSLDAWVRRRLRCLLWRQWKTGKRRYQELRKRDVNADLAAKTAGSPQGPWHLSRSWALNYALPNAFFRSLGLPSLADRHA